MADGRERQGGDHDRQGQPSAAARRRRLVGAAVEDDEVGLGAQHRQPAALPLEEKAVAQLQREVGQPGAQRAAGAPDGEHAHAVAVAEAGLAEGAADEVGAGGEHGLHQHHRAGFEIALAPVARRQTVEVVAGPGARDLAGEQEDVLGPQLQVRGGGAQDAPLALDGEHVHSVGLTQPAAGEGLAGEPGARGHAGPGEGLPQVVDLGEIGLLALHVLEEIGGRARGEQAPPPQGHVGDAGDDDGQAERREVEEAEAGEAAVAQQAAHHDVGGGQQGRHPAQDGAEGERHQQAGGIDPRALGRAGDGREEHGGGGDVVHEQREEGAGQHHRHHQPLLAESRHAHQEVPHPPGDAGALQPRGEDEDREQGDHRRPAEPGEGLLRREHPRGAEGDHDEQRHQVRAQPLGEQEHHGRSGDGQGDDEVGGHGVKCPTPESPISTLPPGKYSRQRRVTVAAVCSSAKSSWGYQGFMRASIRMGGV